MLFLGGRREAAGGAAPAAETVGEGVEDAIFVKAGTTVFQRLQPPDLIGYRPVYHSKIGCWRQRLKRDERCWVSNVAL